MVGFSVITHTAYLGVWKRNLPVRLKSVRGFDRYALLSTAGLQFIASSFARVYEDVSWADVGEYVSGMSVGARRFFI